ncbi:molybdopterin synthase catalytic subunit MoaE [Marinobacter zhejiangensis]|uniref:Molybdopterin synthase catalytic subunit n=1 Tax=Marinobacter zhejiangensis TaxID=488535 RepID=A0A1I4MDD2_9GAMM|nr:molybdopterin synthase catalytic subunit MoaE [Marinobacter zhejiangensis]SFM01073.1 molybdopterin synthase subunit MoaE [Marinobacter zhejiangensis]
MVIIQQQDFDLAEEYRKLRDSGDSTGAIATFTGLVRDYGDLNDVTGLFLEHYPGMTEHVIEGLIAEAGKRWDVRAARVIHRVGTLALGDQIVFVGVCSAHRGDAFAACQFIMDALKTSAPFWKKELSRQGDHWVEQKDSDREQAEQWRESSD